MPPIMTVADFKWAKADAWASQAIEKNGKFWFYAAVEHDDTPRRVDAAPPAVTVAVGGGEPCGGCGSVCITDTRGAVWCWGQLNRRHTPTRVDLTPRSGAPDA